MKIKVNFKCLLLFGMFLISSIVWNPVLAQIPPETAISIKINTPADLARVVPSGDLTIYGTSSDDDTKNCKVYADWNDMKPMQNVTPNGPKGNADYSKWSFTYSGSYHNIVEGPNELTSKITCYDQGQNASSKFYSINVTGTRDGNENTNKPVQTSNENTHNDVSKVLPVKNNNSNSTDNPVQTSNKNTNNDVSKVSKVLPVKNNNSNSTDNPVQTSNKNTDNDVSNVLPIKNNNSKGTYKILPLYSESNEESTHTVASQDKDKTEEVASTDTSESQVSDSEDEALSTDTNTYSTSESEQQEKTGETTTTNMSKAQVTDSEDEALSTDTNTYSTSESEQQEETGETTTTDMNESQVTDSGDEALSTNTNTYFIFEPEQEEDEELTGNNDNTISNSPQTDNPLPNYNHNDGNSVFALNFKDHDEDTENKLENRMENIKERIDDRMHLSDFIG
jgi:hypothetical protein